MNASNTTTDGERMEVVDFDVDPDMVPNLHYNPQPLVISFYGSLIPVALVTNLLLIIIIFKYTFSKIGTNIFIVNLAVADLLVTLVCMPLQLAQGFSVVWWHGLILCKIFYYLQGVSVSSSVFTIAAMAIDRYLSIASKHRSRPWGKMGSAIVLSVIWILALTIFVPVALVASTFTQLVPIFKKINNKSVIVDESVEFCIEHWSDESSRRRFGIISFALVYAIPGSVTIIAYLLMGRVLWSTKPPHDFEGAREGANQALRLKKQRRRLASVLLLIACLFAVCWLPYNILLLLVDLDALGSYSSAASWVLPYALLLGHANSALNPIIYCLVTKSFRKSLRKLICCCGRRERTVQVCRCRQLEEQSLSPVHACHRRHKMCFHAIQGPARINIELQQYCVDTRALTALPTARPSRELRQMPVRAILHRHYDIPAQIETTRL